jgi:hypothetical protein
MNLSERKIRRHDSDLEVNYFYICFQDAHESNKITWTHVHVEYDRHSSNPMSEIRFVHNLFVVRELVGQVEAARVCRMIQDLHEIMRKGFLETEKQTCAGCKESDFAPFFLSPISLCLQIHHLLCSSDHLKLSIFW